MVKELLVEYLKRKWEHLYDVMFRFGDGRIGEE